MGICDLPLTFVGACLRDGDGGSPTAVLGDRDLSDDERRAIPVRAATSHAVFVSDCGANEFGPVVGMRFFTREGELPACGHGTVAALALIAGRTEGDERRMTVSAGGRTFEGRAIRRDCWVDATFDPGVVSVRGPTAAERDPLLAALGLRALPDPSATQIASVGRERLLVRVSDRDALMAVAPDLEALRVACDRWGLLGCYVYSPPDGLGHMAARMFAPSIGVPEDIANANSTACVAAVLAPDGVTEIAVDMGDALGSPATIIASTRVTGSSVAVLVGGAAVIMSV